MYILWQNLFQVIVFRMWIDFEDRTLSHYPVYIKDHLFNTNPTFDYGDFTQIKYYITETNVSIDSFAISFNEAGTYIVGDAQAPARFVIISWSFTSYIDKYDNM